MAGGFLKTLGIVLIVLGGLVVVTGLAAAVLGGSTVSGAASDADRHDCGTLHNEPCSPNARDRAQAGAAVAVAGGGAMLGGALGVVLGIVLLMLGVSRARKAQRAASMPW